MRTAAMLLLCIVCLAWPATATTVVSTAGTTVTPPDNCGFTPTGDGWVRLHLKNDTGAVRDLWVRDGQFYPLRVLDILLPTGVQAPSSVSIDDSQTCGYTRSYGLDECGNYAHDLPSNVGFYAGETASGADTIEIHVRNDAASDPWRTYTLLPGEFALGDIADCQLATGSSLTYLTAVAP